MTDYTLEALKEQEKKLEEKRRKLAEKIKEKERKAQEKERKKLEKKYLVAGEYFMNTVLQNPKFKEEFKEDLKRLNIID